MAKSKKQYPEIKTGKLSYCYQDVEDGGTCNLHFHEPLKKVEHVTIVTFDDDEYIFDSEYYNRDKEPVERLEEEEATSALSYLESVNDTEYEPIIDENKAREEKWAKVEEDDKAVANLSELSFEEQLPFYGLPSAHRIDALTNDNYIGENGKRYSPEVEAEILENTIKLLAIVDIDSKKSKPVLSAEVHEAAKEYRIALLDPSNRGEDGKPKLIYDVAGSYAFNHGGILDTQHNRNAMHITDSTGVEDSQTLQKIYLGIKYNAPKNEQVVKAVEDRIAETLGRPTHFLENYERDAAWEKENRGFFSKLFNR